MRAKTELKVKNLEILQVVNSVETAVNNTLWAIERELSHPDSIFALEKRLVAHNEMITGCGIGFVSDYYPDKGQWFEPYVERLEDGTLDARQIGSESHDYLNSSWYIDAMAADSAMWTEPYLDDAGARELICTYAVPIHDSEGRTVGVMGVDISLDWLVDMFATEDVDEKASILVSRNGRIMACPDKTMVMQTTIDDFAKTYEDTFPPYPNHDEISMYGVLLPAKEVGGDLYDFYIRDDKLFFCLGDVSGKGVPASLVMAVTRSLFRSVTAHNSQPDGMMKLMNNAMSEMNESLMFVTLFIGILDLRNGELHYTNAGHNPPIIIGDGARKLAVDANIPVGLMPNWKYSVQETTIVPGETIFLYTDGLTEAENETHAQFGEECMMELLSSSDKNPHEIIDSVTKAVDVFIEGAEQSDDLTMLAINFIKTKQPS